MSAFSIFTTLIEHQFSDNVSDPEYSKWRDTFNQELRYNVKSKQLGTANGGFTITIPATDSSAPMYIVLRIIGDVVLRTTGKDLDGTTTINGLMPGYGTSLLPGYVMLSTQNLTVISVTDNISGSTVDWFWSVIEEDT